MGLKEWLARKSGVGGYGLFMGGQAVQSGLMLGRALYLGHGTQTGSSNIFIFEDEEQIKAEGFSMYCGDPTHMPPAEDSSELSKETRAAGIAFASFCTFTAADNIMKRENASNFNRSLGTGTRQKMGELSRDLTLDMLTRYMSLNMLQARPLRVANVLNLENPGTNDVLSIFLQEVNRNNPTVGFQRRGHFGFDIFALHMAEEIVKAVSAATQKYNW